MAVTTILAWVGDAFAPTLLGSAPIVLILCNPRLRNLVLTAPTLGAIPFMTVAIGRLVLIDPFFYWFGRRYGDVTIRWMETKLGPGAAIVLWLERFFARTSYVAVTLVPEPMDLPDGRRDQDARLDLRRVQRRRDRRPGRRASGGSATCSPIRCSRSTTGSVNTVSS